MPSYNQNVASPQGTSYFQGIIKPWDDYVLISTGNNTSILVKGKCNSDTGSKLNFDDATVYLLNRTTGTNQIYQISSTDYDTVTVNYTNPYYMYSNSCGLAPNLTCNSANTITCYFVSFAVILLAVDLVIGNAIKLLARRIGR